MFLPVKSIIYALRRADKIGYAQNIVSVSCIIDSSGQKKAYDSSKLTVTSVQSAYTSQSSEGDVIVRRHARFFRPFETSPHQRRAFSFLRLWRQRLWASLCEGVCLVAENCRKWHREREESKREKRIARGVREWVGGIEERFSINSGRISRIDVSINVRR